jgi:LmbE family N-acetylglucosaminyl deacetylase
MPGGGTKTVDLDGLPLGSVETIVGDENLLILVPHPGDESVFCGGLIARLCRRGWPPFVMVLTDGSASDGLNNEAARARLANQRRRETQEALRLLGLPAHRLLMAGLFERSLTADGAPFERLVEGVTMVMWARDCNVICAPWESGSGGDVAVAHRVACQVAAGSGVGQVFYGMFRTAGQAASGAPGWRLDITPDLAAKQAAIAAHAATGCKSAPMTYEAYLRER